MSVEQELLDGTWRIMGVRHLIYRTTNNMRDEMRVWFNTPCGHATQWGHYNFAGEWLDPDGKLLKEPRLFKGCVTCLSCLVNPTPEK